MEISNHQSQSVALEGRIPAKALTVEHAEDQGVVTSPKPETNLVEQQKERQDEKQAENLQGAVSQINDYVQNLQRDLQFTVDETTGKDIVTVIDSESKEVIRQIPSEEALQLARRLAENREDGVQLVSTQV